MMTKHRMTKRTKPAPLRNTEIWTLLAITLVLLYRFPHRLLAAQLWAEDGTVFLMGQRDLGLAALWTPYSGYLHLIPRLVALLWGSLLDLAYIPLAYNLSALLLTLLVALFILRARVPLPCKPVAAFALVFVPHPFEVYLTMTSVQWFFAAALPLFLLQTPSPTRTGRIAEAFVVFIVGLTGPFLLLFSPILAYRGWRDGWKSRGNLLFCAMALAAILLQVVSTRGFLTAPEPAPDFSPIRWLAINGAVVIGGMLLGRNISHFLLGDNTAAFLRSTQNTVPESGKMALLVGVGVVAIGGIVFFWRGLLRLKIGRAHV